MDFRRRLIINLSVIIAAFAFFGIGFYWLGGNLVSQTDKIYNFKKNVEQQKQLVASLASLENIGPQVNSYQTAMDSLLPSKDNLVNLPAYLDGLSRAHQVQTTFVFQGNPVPTSGNNAGYANFSLNVSGPYDNLESFLKDIEEKNTKFLLSLDSYDLTRSGNSYSITCSGRAFFK